jgi:hypothetical protein
MMIGKRVENDIFFPSDKCVSHNLLGLQKYPNPMIQLRNNKVRPKMQCKISAQMALFHS